MMENKHYKKDGIETIDFIKMVNNCFQASSYATAEDAMMIFNIIKYAQRDKGQAVSDALKCADYLHYFKYGSFI